MSVLTKVAILGFTFIAAALSFVLAERYVLHEQSANNYAWPKKIKSATILFGGDMMFDRSVRTAIDRRSSLLASIGWQAGDLVFSCVDEMLENADLVVANLEGPITENVSISAASSPEDSNNFTFTFPTSTAPLLFAHNIRMVNLGNNHILNFGRKGLESTIDSLRNANVGYFGSPIDAGVAESVIRGIPFAFINYNEFSAEGGSSSGGAVASTTTLQIREARAGGHIPIVYTHWGVEYATTSSANSRLPRSSADGGWYRGELAHSFVDAGAEIVIGSHPHVVQEHEIYNGKHIYYSLGNFIFDQYFSEDVRTGLLLEVTFNPKEVQAIKEIPVRLESNRRTCPVLTSA